MDQNQISEEAILHDIANVMKQEMLIAGSFKMENRLSEEDGTLLQRATNISGLDGRM